MIRKTLLLTLLFALTLSAAEIKMLRHPSYHAGKIAFSYAGDIWVANEDGASPHRVTDNRARDVYPRFSPDGKWIAFSSNRHGNYDVFVIPAAGGKAKQLTFHSGNDEVVGWSADSKKVVFRAVRGAAFPTIASLFEVSIDGGLETPIRTDWGYWGAYSADGKQFAYNRHPGVWSRQHYRGTLAADIWIMDVASQKSRRIIPTADGVQGPNSFWPMWASNGDIYFVSDRMPNEANIKPGSPEVMKSVNNIWRIPAAGGRPTQVTKHTSGRLYFPSISSDGKTIVYEEGFGLWKLDVATGASTEVKVHIESDDKENNEETVTVTNEADHFSLSPSARRAVISTRGDLFTIATERGDVTPVASSPWRETVPQWSPDGKWIAFSSDRSGADEIWVCDQLGEKLKKLTTSATEKSTPEWSPDSQYFLYSDSEKKLHRVAVADGKSNVVASSDAGRISAYSFSPDGKWVSFTRQGGDQRAQVYVASAAGGDEHRISSPDMYSTNGAAWTRDGKNLMFTANNAIGGGIASVGAGATSNELFIVSLTKLDKNPADRDVDEEEATPVPAAGGGGRGGAGAAERVPEVKFDWDGLQRRARLLTTQTGFIGNITPAPDSRSAAITTGGGGGGGRGGAAAGGGAGISTIALDTGTLTRINTPTAAAPAPGGAPGGGGGFGGGFSNLQWTRDGRTLYFRMGRGIYAAPIGGGAGAAAPAAAPTAGGGRGGRGGAATAAPAAAATPTGGEPRHVTFTVKIELDLRAERKAIFEESWRIMKHRFYDAKMHGTDWDKDKTIYEPMLDHVYDKEEMGNLIMEMIGEMNASHTGFTPAPPAGGREVATRHPGFDMVPDAAGFYKVGHIYKDGPADHDWVKLHTGDYILAVDDEDLKSGDNFWKNFTIAPSRKFKFLVNSKPSKDGAWDVRIEPVNAGAFGTLQYERWVADRKAMVEKLSDGEIGYVHIRAMDEPSLRRFERELSENHNKKALIIDQRFNGGGGIDQELLAILSQHTRYQYTRNRGGLDVDRPARAFYGPMVVMQNERSASDAEMFPAGFRDLHLGKTLGVHTYGAVIGTGAYTLVDGSTIRTPGSGVYTMSGQNLENYGVPPDVLVDNNPNDYLAGRDLQIEKAVEVLKEDLKGGAKKK